MSENGPVAAAAASQTVAGSPRAAVGAWAWTLLLCCIFFEGNRDSVNFGHAIGFNTTHFAMPCVRARAHASPSLQVEG